MEKPLKEWLEEVCGKDFKDEYISDTITKITSKESRPAKVTAIKKFLLGNIGIDKYYHNKELVEKEYGLMIKFRGMPHVIEVYDKKSIL